MCVDSCILWLTLSDEILSSGTILYTAIFLPNIPIKMNMFTNMKYLRHSNRLIKLILVLNYKDMFEFAIMWILSIHYKL